MLDIQKKAVEAWVIEVEKMLHSDKFSTCPITSTLDTINANISGPHYINEKMEMKVLKTMHCMKFADMSPELRASCWALTRSVLSPFFDNIPGPDLKNDNAPSE